MNLRKMVTGAYVIAFALVLLGLTGCASAPEQEISEANAALEEARNSSQADVWAEEEYQAAKSKLDEANAEIEAQGQSFAMMRSYDRAKELLAEAKSEAMKATEAAKANKEMARNEANENLMSATESIQMARESLEKAPRTKGTRSDIELMTRDLEGLEASLEEVREMIASEDYRGASTKAASVTQLAQEITGQVEQALAKTGRR